jgi:predicted RNase H-like nuclease
MKRYLGVDGCKAGWFVVALNDEDNWSTGIYGSIDALWEKYKTASSILIDIPIGLNSRGFFGRICDSEARSILAGGRASSVFTPPCREALAARTYREACARHEKITGKKLSIQTWNIMKKIREVDDFLRCNGKARSVIRETHPEICFYYLEGRPMQYSKRKREGFQERVIALRKKFPLSDDIIECSLKAHKRKEVQKDDILDALVNALTARFGYHQLSSIPGAVVFDKKNVPMALWYFPFR